MPRKGFAYQIISNYRGLLACLIHYVYVMMCLVVLFCCNELNGSCAAWVSLNSKISLNHSTLNIETIILVLQQNVQSTTVYIGFIIRLIDYFNYHSYLTTICSSVVKVIFPMDSVVLSVVQCSQLRFEMMRWFACCVLTKRLLLLARIKKLSKEFIQACLGWIKGPKKWSQNRSWINSLDKFLSKPAIQYLQDWYLDKKIIQTKNPEPLGMALVVVQCAGYFESKRFAVDSFI